MYECRTTGYGYFLEMIVVVVVQWVGIIDITMLPSLNGPTSIDISSTFISSYKSLLLFLYHHHNFVG